MADLTIGEVGKILQLNLINFDQTQNPPTQMPLDLTNATQILLIFVLTDEKSKPRPPFQQRTMGITNATGGIVQYAFIAGDLVKPGDMGKDGVFRYAVKVTFAGGIILFSNFDGRLSVKDDSVL